MIENDIDSNKDALINKLADDLERSNYLNSILLDSIPHPALLVTKNRRVIAANKHAKEAGTIVGGLCWRDFGHCLYINDEQKRKVDSSDSSSVKGISCYFCKANSALEEEKLVNIQEKVGNEYLDIYWVPTQEKDVYLHYSINITERKRIEERLKYAQHIACIGDIEVDVFNKKVYWSDEVFHILGYQPQEFIPSYYSYEKHFNKKDKEFIRQKFANMTPHNSSFSFECKFNKLNGEKGWLDIKGNTEFDIETSKPIRIFMIIQDITDRKQAEIIRKANEDNGKRR